eukprot:4666770-Amphidinium_carterae.1
MRKKKKNKTTSDEKKKVCLGGKQASDQYGNIATAEQRGLVVDWTLNTNSSLGPALKVWKQTTPQAPRIDH